MVNVYVCKHGVFALQRLIIDIYKRGNVKHVYLSKYPYKQTKYIQDAFVHEYIEILYIYTVELGLSLSLSFPNIQNPDLMNVIN